MIFLDDIVGDDPRMRTVMQDVRALRVHQDVVNLVGGLIRDPSKLESAAPYMFMPAYRTWIEWEADDMNVGFFFDGRDSVTEGVGLLAVRLLGQKERQSVIGTRFSIPDYTLALDHTAGLTPAKAIETARKLGMPLEKAMAMFADIDKIPFEESMSMANILRIMKPCVYAILALINSPKIIRQHEVDVSRLNKRRQALGRYTFHPHHEVRLNIDKRMIDTTAGTGDGASRCLHFVRTHLRLVPHLGQYTLVSPHWRGDPAIGIRDTHYRVDRANSKWK